MMYPDSYCVESLVPEDRRRSCIRIGAHGKPGYLRMNGMFVAAEALAFRLHALVDFDRVGSVHIAACRVAVPADWPVDGLRVGERWHSSYAARLSRSLPGIRVEAYLGMVGALTAESLYEIYQNCGMEAALFACRSHSMTYVPAPGLYGMTFLDGVATAWRRGTMEWNGRVFTTE